MVLRNKPDGRPAFSGDRQGTWWGLVGGQPSSTAAWRCRQPAPQSCTRPTCPQCWGRRCAPPTAAQSIPSPAHTRAAALNKSPVGSRCSFNVSIPLPHPQDCLHLVSLRPSPRASATLLDMDPAVSHLISGTIPWKTTGRHLRGDYIQEKGKAH